MQDVHPLKSFRARAHLTQEGLADMLGVKRTTVARWETGTRKPDRELLPSIVAKTGIPARELRPDLAELLESADQ